MDSDIEERPRQVLKRVRSSSKADRGWCILGLCPIETTAFLNFKAHFQESTIVRKVKKDYQFRFAFNGYTNFEYLICKQCSMSYIFILYCVY